MEGAFPCPSLIAACDWSLSPHKRWLCVAQRMGDGAFEIAAPVPAGDVRKLVSGLRLLAPQGAILAGFDFPIGLPRAYCTRANIRSFTDLLPRLGTGEWARFFQPAEKADEVSIYRPFYPRAPGGTSKQQLVTGLGVPSATDLLRACDYATSARPGACEIFWTLGAKQVGRAAIAGWRDLIAPSRLEEDIRIWPFDGDLLMLLGSGKLVLAEIYPAETYGHIGIPSGFGKTSQPARRLHSERIMRWCEGRAVRLAPELREQILLGFAPDASGEDQLDAFIGALGLLEACGDPAHFEAPADAAIRNVEGWILGMTRETTASRQITARLAPGLCNDHQGRSRQNPSPASGLHARSSSSAVGLPVGTAMRLMHVLD